MIERETKLTRRWSLAAIGSGAVLFAGLTGRNARAAGAEDAAAAEPIRELNNALLASMKAGGGVPFAERYRGLSPVIEHVFDLDDVLARSVGLSWSSMPAAQKSMLAAAFRRYTVSSYLANFDSFNGQSFEVMPDTRAVGEGQVVVRSRLVRAGGSPIALDYVMSRGPRGWQAVDVLTNGTISRVAVQRSDFRGLLASGGVPALTSSLESKVASLSGGMAA